MSLRGEVDCACCAVECQVVNIAILPSAFRFYSDRLRSFIAVKFIKGEDSHLLFASAKLYLMHSNFTCSRETLFDSEQFYLHRETYLMQSNFIRRI